MAPVLLWRLIRDAQFINDKIRGAGEAFPVANSNDTFADSSWPRPDQASKMYPLLVNDPPDV